MATADRGAAPVAPDPEVRPVRWGVMDAVVGWVVAEVAAVLIGGLILAAAGYSGDRATVANLPLTLIALSYPPLWLGFVGAPLLATITRGNGPVRDLGARIRRIDVPIGVIVGVASQLILVPLISLPMLEILGKTRSDLSRPAQILADKADNPLGVLLLVLIVVIGAPIAEELFFRGLVLRAVERRLGMPAAIGISAVAFGVTHFEALQMAALTAFGLVLGYLVHRTGRLGTSIVTHMAFNSISVITLLVQR